MSQLESPLPAPHESGAPPLPGPPCGDGLSSEYGSHRKLSRERMVHWPTTGRRPNWRLSMTLTTMGGQYSSSLGSIWVEEEGSSGQQPDLISGRSQREGSPSSQDKSKEQKMTLNLHLTPKGHQSKALIG